MELTRRDAIKALMVSGTVAAGTGLAASEFEGQDDIEGSSPFTERDLATLVAVAQVVYPSEVDGIREFVETYARGISTERRGRMAQAIQELTEFSQQEFGGRFETLSESQRDTALREMGVDRVPSDPDGNVPERIRYFLVNQLLYGLFTSPKGGQLYGVTNPIGYPGGYESYTRPP